VAKNEVKISITGDASKLGKALGDGEKQLSGFSSKADQIGSKMQKVGAAATVGVTLPLIAMGTSSVKAFMEAEQSQAQLEASLKSTGATAWTSADQMDDLASSMQDKLAIDGDLIKSGQSVLLTFTNVRNEVGEGNDVFDQATQLAADLSVKLGTDLQSANILLGKALNDPIKGMGALRKAGVQLTESQEAQVEQYVAMGDVMSAQKIILQELETQFGGSAEAFAGTAAGKLEKAKLQFEDIQEEIGEKLIPVLSKLGDFVTTGLDAWDKLGDTGQNVVLVFAGIAAAAGPVSTAVGTVMRLGDQMGALKGKLVETSTSADGTTRSLTNVGKAATLLGGAGAAFAVYQLAQALNTATEDALGLETALNEAKTEKTVKGLQDIAASTEGIGDKAKDFGSIFGSMFADPAVEVDGLRFEIDNLGDTLDRIKSSGDKELLQFAIDNFRDAKVEGTQARIAYDKFLPTLDKYQAYLDSSSDAADAVAGSQGEMAGTAGDATAAMDSLGEAGGGVADAFDAVDESLAENADAMARWNSAADGAAEGATAFGDAIERSSQIDDALSNASKLGTVMRGFGDSIKALPKDIDQTTLAMGGYNEEQQKSIDALISAGDANAAYLSGLLAQGASSEDVAFSADVLRQQYVKQAKQLGLNDEQTQDYIETLNLTPEQVTTAIRLSEMAAAEFRIRAYQGLINSTPPNKLTKFNAALAQGDVIAAARALDDLARPREVFFGVRVVGGTAAQGVLRGIGNIAGRAGGGPISAGVPYMVGEKGPELIFPEHNGMVMTASETAALMSNAGGSSLPVGYTAASPTQVVVNVDARGSLMTNDLSRQIVGLVEEGVAKGVQAPRLKRAMSR
jgi:hypothetical protein